MMYDSSDRSATDRIFCHFGQFLALLLPNNTKNENFEKMKKLPRDIIFHRCNINDNHMIYMWFLRYQA